MRTGAKGKPCVLVAARELSGWYVEAARICEDLARRCIGVGLTQAKV